MGMRGSCFEPRVFTVSNFTDIKKETKQSAASVKSCPACRESSTMTVMGDPIKNKIKAKIEALKETNKESLKPTTIPVKKLDPKKKDMTWVKKDQ
jgi:hypothetical protein